MPLKGAWAACVAACSAWADQIGSSGVVALAQVAAANKVTKVVKVVKVGKVT